MDGAAGFDASVAKDQPVVIRTSENGEKSIEFHAAELGTVNVYGFEKGVVSRVEYRPIEWYAKRHEENPDDFGEPDAGMLFSDSVEYLPWPKKPDKGLFDVTPAKGKMVDDRRKKG